MKLNQKDNTKLIYSNVSGTESIPFSIGDAAFVIGILRDKIYSTPIYAVVSEYLSNAKDACAEAGKESDQISVSLPTQLNPTFVIRDYGVGMSPQRIQEVFVKYGISTKRSDNSQVGCWGLGCKAAWSYSDSFVVASYFDGVYQEYIADISETKEGRLLCTKQEQTDEPNGVSIKIPVHNGDLSKFENAYIKATMLWDKKPSLNFKVTYPSVVYERGKLKIYKFNERLSSDKFVLDSSGLPFSCDPLNFSQYISDNTFVCIKANPIKLGISANRESFSNKEYAKDLVRNELDGLIEHLKQKFDSTPFSKHVELYFSMPDLQRLINHAYYQTRSYSFYSQNKHQNLTLRKGYFLDIDSGSFVSNISNVSNLNPPPNTKYFLTKSKGKREISKATNREITPVLEIETKRAILAVKKENALRRKNGENAHRIYLLFQELLDDSEYLEIAEIKNATEYIEDVYGKSKISRKVSIRTNNVSLFTVSYRKHCNQTKEKHDVLDLLKTYDKVFYGLSCESSTVKLIEECKVFGGVNWCFVHALSHQRKYLEELNNPNILTIEDFTYQFRMHPIVETLADVNEYRSNHDLWSWVIENVPINSYDLSSVKSLIPLISDIYNDLRFYSIPPLPKTSGLLNKIKINFPLLSSISFYRLSNEGKNDLKLYLISKDKELCDAKSTRND